ncbi:pilus assembly protein [Dyella sp.]|uniref:pilus assembly protein n=1 Tax=Dyella sp. TaxID=1869338 RepID=UPI002D76D2C9|nr:PilC/PilY family type IV pilus protein [Dyella sp.]HET7331732.1 PilC/PilY family type IV pilus protein [Dyella sp.]
MLKTFRHVRLNARLLACMMALTASAGASATTLSDTPVYSTSNVPANLMLALSVEYPTGTVAAYKDSAGYAIKNTYLGYFDPAKCYDYSSTTGTGYFAPVSGVSGPVCTGHWSGNMLNWALMTSLDEFRQALTGGNRSVDNATTTVLQRSNLNSQTTIQNFPIKKIGTGVGNVDASTVIGDSQYSSLSTVYLFSYQQGSKFIISNNYTPPNDKTNPKTPPTVVNDGGKNFYTVYNAQVQVCVPGILESNCNSAHAATDYVGAHTYNKPEGLIQQNYTKIRVGASAYAFLKGNSQPNGVVRALLRDNGPTSYNGYGARQTNTYSEWDANTGAFITNPDAADSTYATAPGGVAFTDSGAINYLNKFGYGSDYEQYDNISDLYWATLAYYMQVPLDASYTTGLSQSNSTDPTFPVFKGTAAAKASSPTINDPIQFTCQNNAIVTIGDAHTWYDTAVPSTAPTGGTLLSPLPVGGTVGAALDASKYVTKLGNLPLMEAQGTTAASQTMAQYQNTTALGTIYEISGASATYNMAGLAYYAHINDIRADITGNQKITTYTVDVLEPGNYDGTSSHPTYSPSNLSSGAGPDMYWLAAKYGGFNDVNGDGNPANMLTWHTNSTSATTNDLRPDNYFPGNRPDLIQSGLQQIFNNVASTASQSGSGLSVNSSHGLTNVTSGAAPYYAPVAGFPAYTTQYTPVTWTGDVAGFIATTATGSDVTAASGSTPWHAQLQLDTLTQTASSSSGTTTLGWSSGRRVVTWNGSKGVPFRYSSLSSTEQGILDQTGNGSKFVDYLRGDKSNESTLFRARTHILGDIVNSAAVLVQGALSTSYSDTNNPGYASFSSNVASRQPVVYVGANDGMMHAFEADFLGSTSSNPVTGGGSELFAYVPSMLFNGPNNTPLVDGLPALANLDGVSANNFSHHYYVDATPQVADVDFTYTSDGTANPSTTAKTADWHTILVGGLGKGGKGIYALDVTNVPAAVDTTSSSTVETSQASKVLWEFTDADMGYSYGPPLIIKTRKYGWVVAMTSGYNNTGGKLAGHGILYILNIKTGAILQKIDTGAGTATSPAGLTQATAFTQDVTDGTVDQIYAGDLLGNVWRFDLTEAAVDSSGTATGDYPSPTLFATLADPSGKAQPITTAPRVEESLSSNGLAILRWVFVGTGKFLDITDLTDTQQQTMYALRDGSGSTPSTSGLPLKRTALTAITDLTQGTTVSDSSTGWYYDLTGSAGGNNGGTERIVVAPAAATGLNIVAWTTVIPSSDPCSLQGALYATNYSGASVLMSGGSTVKYLTTSAAPTGVQLLQNTDGTVTVASSTSAGVTTFKAVNQNNNSNLVHRVNWREVLN